MPAVEFCVLAGTHKLTFHSIWNPEKSPGLARWLYTGNQKSFSQIKYGQVKLQEKAKILKVFLKKVNDKMSYMMDPKVSHYQVLQENVLLLNISGEILIQWEQK